MEGNNNHEEEGEILLQKNHPWLARDAVAIPRRVHNLPRHPEKLLPKYDLETSGLPEDHIKKFILVIRLMVATNNSAIRSPVVVSFANLSR